MDMTNIFKYLEKRQLGYSGDKRRTYDMFIEKLGHVPEEENPIFDVDVGNTFACKFSKNKNNLHVVGCVTEHGEIIIQNTFSQYPFNEQYKRNAVHENAIFNFAWAEPEMKLVTASGDHTSKICSVSPSGKVEEEKEFNHSSSVKSVMFCPGSSNVFCTGCQDGSIIIWDARVNNSKSVLGFERNIPNTYGFFGKRTSKKSKTFGVTSVIFKNELTVISACSIDPYVKVWDLRKSYRQVTKNVESVPLMKYCHDEKTSNCRITGYTDILLNPESSILYASGIQNIIHCYSLDSTDSATKHPIHQYSGHYHETTFSKISISGDGRYLFSGCMLNSGFIWLTDFPYNEKPAYQIFNDFADNEKELSTSDWCADSNCLKLVASADSLPMVWTVLTYEQRKSIQIRFTKTLNYKSQKISKDIFTAPVKLEIKEQFRKQTETNMENWDDLNKNSILKIEDLNENSNENTLKDDDLPTTPKNQWKALFTKTSSDPVTITCDSKQNPEVVTPTSCKKRKKGMMSPRSLIDQYLVPTKREKLDTINETDENKI